MLRRGGGEWKEKLDFPLLTEGGLGERRELPQRDPGFLRFCKSYPRMLFASCIEEHFVELCCKGDFWASKR